MESFKMTEKYFQELYDRLLKISEKCQEVNEGKEEKNSEVYQTYSLDTENGKKFYMRITDEELLNRLKKESKKLNHSPSQKEIFWVWREYIKKRFGKWPYALKAAGLSKSAGAGGKTLKQMEADLQEYQLLLEEVRESARKLCRIPHPQELPQLCEKLKKFTNNWNDIIYDAELDAQFFRQKAVYRIEDLELEYREEIKKIFLLAQSLGRPPLKSEIEKEMKEKLIARCGSWRNVLYQIDLEPITRIKPFSSSCVIPERNRKDRVHKSNLHDCYYRVLNLDEQTVEDLSVLYNLKKDLKRIPDRKEVSPIVRKRLQKKCGSWANAIYQLEYIDKRKDN